MFSEADACCELKAAAQRGMVSREQALACGQSKDTIADRLACGSWNRIFPSTYQLRPVKVTWEGRLVAAHLWAGPTSRISHRSAAAAYRLRGFRKGVVEVTMTRRLRAPRGILAHYSSEPPPRVLIDGSPVTPIERTLLDLGAVCHRKAVERGLDDALLRNLTSLEKLYSFIASYGKRGRRGTATLRELVALRDPNSELLESLLEQRMHSISKGAGLPTPRLQYQVFDDRGIERGRFDFAHPEILLGIEVDGYGSHSSAQDTQRDKARDRWLTMHGWRILRFTWEEVMHRPEQVVREISEALVLLSPPA